MAKSRRSRKARKTSKTRKIRSTAPQKTTARIHARRQCPAPAAAPATYEAVADSYAARRSVARLSEAPVIEALTSKAPGPRVLDLGCGTGAPIGLALARRGFRVTGVDSSPSMLRHFQKNVPGGQAHLCLMQGLSLRKRFDAILAWDSFFHLDHATQSRMFRIFARHAKPGAILIFSSGPKRGFATGAVSGQPVFHASHDPLVYRQMLTRADFEVLSFRPEDEKLTGHSWWICRKT